MRIRFHKVTDAEHLLEIDHGGGAVERVACETRSYLEHDLLHYAVEAEADLHGGFWGRLAAGETLAFLNERARDAPTGGGADELAMIETLVGVASGLQKGADPADLVARLRDNAAALSFELPPWFGTDYLQRVQRRMLHLLGHFRGTPRGQAMTLEWPPAREH